MLNFLAKLFATTFCYSLAVILYILGGIGLGLFVTLTVVATIIYWAIGRDYYKERTSAINMLYRNLPKIGFKIENYDWDETGTKFVLSGTFMGNYMMMAAQTDSRIIRVCHAPCVSVSANRLDVRFFEALNYANLQSVSGSVVLDVPDKEGERIIRTEYLTHVPVFKTRNFLFNMCSSVCEGFNRFTQCLNFEYPWLATNRGPVGFETPANKDAETSAAEASPEQTPGQTPGEAPNQAPERAPRPMPNEAAASAPDTSGTKRNPIGFRPC